MFKPLAFTKTFALIASIVIALTLIPPFAHILFCMRLRGRAVRSALYGLLAAGGVALAFANFWAGAILAVFAVWRLADAYMPEAYSRAAAAAANWLIILAVGWALSRAWEPLGAQAGAARNAVFVGAALALLLGGLAIFHRFYVPLLRLFLRYKAAFLCVPAGFLLFGACVWLGFGKVFAWAPEGFRQSPFGLGLARALPGLGKEFMPDLDEGSFLYMPITMPHASIGEAAEQLAMQDMAFQAIPEIESAVGKIGRVESALDPAPITMVETVINYKPEYILDTNGARINFRFDKARGEFVRDENGELIPDPRGRPFRQWRDEIRSSEDIWKEIVEAGKLPGMTSAPKLQPIAARLVMLQSGMRAPMGVKIKGPDLETIESVGLRIEAMLKDVDGVRATAVIADRIVGIPYLEIDLDRERLARYGIRIQDVQDVIETAIGGKEIARTVEGRERYAVRVRYARELRDTIEDLERILIPASAMSAPAAQIPLAQLAEIKYQRGPGMIKSEDTFPIGYVLFDKQPGRAEVDVVENARRYLAERLDPLLPDGVSYQFAGTYENQLRAVRTLSIVVPMSLFAIFLILYLQFRSVLSTSLVFSGVIVAWAGGFLMIWLYGQPWFLNFDVLGVSMRELFQVHPINMSVAVWVGFLALFGIAEDDGVVMLTYIKQSFERHRPETVAEIREAIVAAGQRRIRPCLMTTATTILALLPVLTSHGKGADIMVPMAIPSFGGMAIELVTLFVVPVVYCGMMETQLWLSSRRAG